MRISMFLVLFSFLGVAQAEVPEEFQYRERVTASHPALVTSADSIVAKLQVVDDALKEAKDNGCKMCLGMIGLMNTAIQHVEQDLRLIDGKAQTADEGDRSALGGIVGPFELNLSKTIKLLKRTKIENKDELATTLQAAIDEYKAHSPNVKTALGGS